MFAELKEDSDLAQGDIICNYTTSTDVRRPDTIGVILTADCDIVQGKTGKFLNWLRIVEAREYIESIWAPAQINRIVEKQAAYAVGEINSTLRKHGRESISISKESLSEWLLSSSPERICARICNSTQNENKLLNSLRVLSTTLGSSTGNHLKTLKATWDAQNIDSNSQIARIKEAISGSNGFSDYFFLPEISNVDGIGFCILLRSIDVVALESVYKSFYDAKVGGSKGAFVRVARLSDNLRFSMAQKLAFLFSRIGMPRSFEELCESACSLCSENLP